MTNKFKHANIIESTEYKLINEFYNSRVAKRSTVPLINHINEGMEYLLQTECSDQTIKAFAIHPLIQNDSDLFSSWSNNKFKYIDSDVLMLAFEYRNIANQYLSHRSINILEDIALSPIAEVNNMLRADKIQNYKDFIIYHSETHSRSNILDDYFNNWLDRLQITDTEFSKWFTQLQQPLTILETY